MDFTQSKSLEEAFVQAEAEARLAAALKESEARFGNARIPDTYFTFPVRQLNR